MMARQLEARSHDSSLVGGSEGAVLSALYRENARRWTYRANLVYATDGDARAAAARLGTTGCEALASGQRVHVTFPQWLSERIARLVVETSGQVQAQEAATRPHSDPCNLDGDYAAPTALAERFEHIAMLCKALGATGGYIAFRVTPEGRPVLQVCDCEIALDALSAREVRHVADLHRREGLLSRLCRLAQ